MKEWIKKINENKFQFFFFASVLAFLFVSLIVVGLVGDNQVDDPLDDNTPVVPDTPTEDEQVTTVTVEVVKLPFEETMSYNIVRTFYERSGTKEEQEKALIKYGSSYRTSVGTSYSESSNKAFNVNAALSGTVTEVKENPLYGNYVVLDHKDGVKTCYYGLSEVTVTVGATVNQGDKIGTSGTTEIDQGAGNHIYFQILKNNKYLNPEKQIGKKITDL